MKCIAISDTHTMHEKLTIPECDLLIHSGDWSFNGTTEETTKFGIWLNKQPAKHIVVVPGNHEVIFKTVYPESRDWILDHCPKAKLLVQESVIIEDLHIFGSPWTPFFCDWAYNGARTESEHHIRQIPLLKDIWKEIPMDTDLLVTHGPPHGILDLAPRGERTGCWALMDKVAQVKPKVHVFGHIHYQYGEKLFNGTLFLNASSCDEQYNCIHAPIEFEI